MLEAAIPSVAGSAVIGASFPVTQIVGTLGDLTDILEFEIQVVDITSTSATVTAQTSIDVACAVAFGTIRNTDGWPLIPTWAVPGMATTFPY